MGKDPAVLFYTSDFLGGVTLMSMKERGQYITLLCLQRERGHMTEKEMQKAIGGKLSEELRSKFVLDEEGRLYNVRMETEVQKRNAHCQKQRENIQKRWAKEKATTTQEKPNKGNTMVHTMVLPLGNGSGGGNGNTDKPIEKRTDVKTNKQEEKRVQGEKGDGLIDPEFGRVMDFFLDKINPTPSPISVAGLRDFTQRLSADVVIHALQVAMDERKNSWSFIQGVLDRYVREDLTSVSAVLRSDREYRGRKSYTGRQESSSSNPFLRMLHEEEQK